MALVRKLGRLGCQVGRLGGHVGRLGRQVGSPRRSKRRLEPSPRSLRTHACDRPTARTLGRRFFVDFVLSRESRDVPRVPVFTVFCWLRTKLAVRACTLRECAQNHHFRTPKPCPSGLFERKIDQIGRCIALEAPPGPPKIYLFA